MAAEAAFRRLVALAPRLAEARHGLARTLAAQGRYDEAVVLLLELAGGTAGARSVDYAAEAAALDPASGPAQLALGRALLLEQRFTAALEPLARSAERMDDDPTPHLFLGLARWECGQIGAARESLERAVERSGRGRVAVHQLGRLHLWQGRPDLALPLLREALAGAPGSIDLLLDYAQALERSGAADEALALLLRLAPRAPDSEAVRYALGRLLMLRGEPTAARVELETYERLRTTRMAMQADEGRERARLDYGWSLLAAGRDGEARELFASLPVAAESLAGLARARMRLGDADGAVEALERAVTLSPDRQDLRVLLAEARAAASGGEQR